jgi:hypothetical protein
MTGKICPMVCGYDKVKVGRIAIALLGTRVLRKAEAAMLELTPTAPAAYYGAPARWIGCFERCLRGVCVPETLLSWWSLAERSDGDRSPGGCDDG